MIVMTMIILETDIYSNIVFSFYSNIVFSSQVAMDPSTSSPREDDSDPMVALFLHVCVSLAGLYS